MNFSIYLRSISKLIWYRSKLRRTSQKWPSCMGFIKKGKQQRNIVKVSKYIWLLHRRFIPQWFAERARLIRFCHSKAQVGKYITLLGLRVLTFKCRCRTIAQLEACSTSTCWLVVAQASHRRRISTRKCLKVQSVSTSIKARKAWSRAWWKQAAKPGSKTQLQQLLTIHNHITDRRCILRALATLPATISTPSCRARLICSNINWTQTSITMADQIQH